MSTPAKPEKEKEPEKPAEPPLSALTDRMVEAGAPPLPGDLQYLVIYHPTFNDGVLVHLDIRSKDKRTLLASVERTFQRKQLTVKDFVAMAFEACEQMTFENKLPPAVRKLLIGADL